MNKREIQREETKRRIYDCAFRLFEKKGFHNVKVKDIAKEAGLSIGGVYHHHRSKEDIVDYGYYTFDEMLKEYYESVNPVSPEEGIRTLIRFQMDTCIQYSVKIITITFRSQINSENRYRYWEGRYIWTKLVENLQGAGLSDEESRTAARYILRSSNVLKYKNGEATVETVTTNVPNCNGRALLMSLQGVHRTVKQVPADTVIVSVGYTSDQTLYDAIKGEHVHLLGDADHPGNLMSAIWGAYTTALNI